MRPIKYAFGITISAILILVSALFPSSLSYVSGSFVGLGAALLGSFLVMWYETSKERKEKFEKRKKALSIVYTDITRSLGPLETAPKEGLLMLWPSPHTGWEVLAMTGSFNLESELDSKIADVYERIEELNTMISWTLTLRFSASQAVPEKALSNMIKLLHNQINIVIPRLRTTKTDLEKELGMKKT